MQMDYEEFLAGLVVDLIAISLLTYALYFRRHQRRDLTLGLLGINIGLFARSIITSINSVFGGLLLGIHCIKVALSRKNIAK